jgi:hypothetical protein
MDRHQEWLKRTPKWRPEMPPEDIEEKEGNGVIKLLNGVKHEIQNITKELY